MNKYFFYIFILLLPCAAFGQSKKSDGYFARGVELYRAGDYAGAVEYFEKSWQLDQTEIAPESNRYAYSLSWLASCYYKMGDKQKARQLSAFDCDMTPVDRRLTVEADREGDLSNRAFMDGDIDGSIQHALKCLELERAVLGEPSFPVVGTYLTLGDRYNNKGDAASAASWYTKAINAIHSLGCESDIAEYQARMGRCYSYIALENLSGALTDAEAAGAIGEKECAETGDSYALALTKTMMARILLQTNDTDGAAAQLKEALAMLSERYAGSPDDSFMHIVECLNLFAQTGHYTEGEKQLNDLVDMVKANGGKRYHLGMLYSFHGDYAQSLPDIIRYYRMALDCLDEPGAETDYYATVTALAHYTGRSETVSLLNSVVAYYDRTGRDGDNCRSALMTLGDLYGSEGRYEPAIDCYMKALTMPGFDRNSPAYLLTVIKASPVYINYSFNATGEIKPVFRGFNFSSELSRALLTVLNNNQRRNGTDMFAAYGIGRGSVARSLLPLYRLLLSKATLTPVISWVEIDRQLTSLLNDYLSPVYGEEEDIVRETRAVLAHAKYVQGDYPSAIGLMNQTVASAKAAGREYDNYLHDLAYYQYDSGDTAGAYDNFVTGYNFNKNNILSKYRWMTLSEREDYTAERRGNIDNMPHYAALTPDDRRYAALGYNALLFSKGLLLNSTIELSRLLQEAGDRETLAILEKWRSLSRKYQRAQADGNPDADLLKDECERLERSLLERSAIFGDYTRGLTVEYQQVQRRLGENDVAVEFFCYPFDARSQMYGALLLTRSEPPRYVPVGIDRDWRSLADSCYTSPALFSTLFGSLKPYMPGRDRGSVYFAPAGELYALAIENMAGAEAYDLRRLSSTRELALADSTGHTPAVQSMAVYGGIKYGTGKLAQYYAATDGTLRESGQFLNYLPGTEIEADDISRLMSERLTVSPYTKNKATESSFKKLSGKRIGLLHVATHGFFDNPATDGAAAQSGSDAMASSGLYFAGAQNTLWGEDTAGMKDDGILTSDEISVLDLRGLQLAVLSACDTGSGLAGPDGVFGLQRGFKQAGAGSLLMSLWKVDDAATRMLMCEFYRRLLAGDSQYQALHAARQAVRKQYPEPRAWAAFVLMDAVNKVKL